MELLYQISKTRTNLVNLESMYPVLFNIGSYSVTSFGFFLAVSIFFGLFIIWRIALVYDLDKEKIIDLSLLTVLGSFIGARAYYILFSLDQFNSLYKMVFFVSFPGLSFWGGFVGGILALWLVSKKFKMNFWQVADFAIVALLLSLSVGSIGCLLGSCQYGQVSDLPIAVSQIGVIGKRFPLQVVEFVVLLLLFIRFWRAVLRFHFAGKVASLGLVCLGFMKLVLEFFRGDAQQLVGYGLTYGLVFSLSLILAGALVYFRLSKKPIKEVLRSLKNLLLDAHKRKFLLFRLQKSWYNLMISWKMSLSQKRKLLLKTLNVKSNPNKF